MTRIGRTRLMSWTRRMSRLHDAREYDVVVASGEQVTAGLLAIVLEGMGVNARSWQGWQLPILTSNAHASARILDVNGAELMQLVSPMCVSASLTEEQSRRLLAMILDGLRHPS